MIEHPIKQILKTLPTQPGCYEYLDKSGSVLYVGKAKNLRKRVTSYFQNYHELTARLQIMIDNAVDVEVHIVDTEVEALLLEASLIKKYRPKYNILLKDDKFYSWIKVTKDQYPIVYRTRNNNDKNAYYFGPFTSTVVRDQIFNFLRKEFPFRTCSYDLHDEELAQRKERRARGERVRSRICTYYHIGRCGAPCEGLVSHDEYSENINNIRKFLQNKKKVIVKDLEGKMKYYAKNEEFEKAARVKMQLDSLGLLSRRMIEFGDDEDDVRRLAFQRSQKGLETLIKKLKIKDLKSMTKEEKAEYLGGFRMECYDISNIQGTNPVGSMVVFEGGLAKKAHYRKFKINVKDSPDDFAMMREMLSRRFRYLTPAKNLELRKSKKLSVDAQNAKILERLNISNSKLKTFKKDSQSTSEKSANQALPHELEHADIEAIISFKELAQDNERKLPPKQADDIVNEDVNKLPAGAFEALEFEDNSKLDPSFYSIPDLIIIDGGKGQLRQGIDVLHDLKLDNLFVCGLAKRREEIFLPGAKEGILFDDKPEALFLLQRIRDEAHRFGITYHRQRRSKAMLK